MAFAVFAVVSNIDNPGPRAVNVHVRTGPVCVIIGYLPPPLGFDSLRLISEASLLCFSRLCFKNI